MKKYAVFALIVCLSVIAVAAVLSVTYPEMQQKFAQSIHDAGERISGFFELFFRPFKEAFIRR